MSNEHFKTKSVPRRARLPYLLGILFMSAGAISFGSCGCRRAGGTVTNPDPNEFGMDLRLDASVNQWRTFAVKNFLRSEFSPEGNFWVHHFKVPRDGQYAILVYSSSPMFFGFTFGIGLVKAGEAFPAPGARVFRGGVEVLRTTDDVVAVGPGSSGPTQHHEMDGVIQVGTLWIGEA